MAADVTERKEAERALRESEFACARCWTRARTRSCCCPRRAEVLAINKAAERRLAKREGGGPLRLALTSIGLLPRDQVEGRMAIVRRSPRRRRSFIATYRSAHAGSSSGSIRCFEPDKPVSEVAVYAREITEQKKSQADLSKLFQAIQQSPMSVVITDRDGNIEYVNPEFTKVTGYTLAEAIGQNPRILKSGHTPPEQYAELWKTISAGRRVARRVSQQEEERRAVLGARLDRTGQGGGEDHQLRRRQGGHHRAQGDGGAAPPVAEDAGRGPTHRRHRARFQQPARHRHGQSAAVGRARERRCQGSGIPRRCLWSARRGGELTHRLLAFARKQPLKPAVIDLNDVVRGMTELLRRTLGASIRIEESLAPDLWKAFADRGELERALVNLAVNSRDAMRSAGTLTLETRNAVLDEDYAEQYEEVTPGEYVLLAVTDTGTGMPPEIMERVFEPFFTTKEVGQGSGPRAEHGLRLRQAVGRAHQHLQPRRARHMREALPAAGAVLPGGAEKKVPGCVSGGPGNKVVLVVEDEAKLRKVGN